MLVGAEDLVVVADAVTVLDIELDDVGLADVVVVTDTNAERDCVGEVVEDTEALLVTDDVGDDVVVLLTVGDRVVV